MNNLKYVNCKQGSKSTFRFSNGNTLPFVQMPFGMVGFVPQTDSSRGHWFYHPDDRTFEGIRLSHQPSPWVGDYGTLILMPQIDNPKTKAADRLSSFKPEDTIINPDYFKIRLLKSSTTFELSPTDRGAAFSIKFERGEKRYLSVLSAGGYCEYRLDEKSQTVYGMTRHCSIGGNSNFAMYFVIKFETQIDFYNSITSNDEDKDKDKDKDIKGENIGLHICFGDQDAVKGKMAISYISEEQALLNLEKEIGNRSLTQIKSLAQDRWDALLSRLKSPKGQEKTFYSCLYRACLFPHKFFEYDINGKEVHHSVSNNCIENGFMYTDNGFWDTYRTVYPLFAILIPDEYRQMLKGFLNFYLESGWLPKWICPFESGIMPGTMIDAVLADAAVRGILTDEDLKLAYEAMLKQAEKEGSDKNGRKYLNEYRDLGYISCESCGESVNNTLDYAYSDFCVSVVAGILGDTKNKEKYSEYSKNYKNLFDPETGFMRGRCRNGEFNKDFSPFAWGGDYCEGGAWQNSFNVPYDIDGLCSLFKTKEKLIEKLDELFSCEPIFDVGGYGKEIHEMSEMACADFGQCAISNQPSFHIPFLYAALGDKNKTKYWVNRIINEAFSDKDDGFPGDEDNGSMAAWYIFASLGYYPLCPGKPEFILFDEKG